MSGFFKKDICSIYVCTTFGLSDACIATSACIELPVQTCRSVWAESQCKHLNHLDMCVTTLLVSKT